VVGNQKTNTLEVYFIACSSFCMERRQLGGIARRAARREDEDCQQVTGGPAISFSYDFLSRLCLCPAGTLVFYLCNLIVWEMVFLPLMIA
jgi:hypothetical protein